MGCATLSETGENRSDSHATQSSATPILRAGYANGGKAASGRHLPNRYKQWSKNLSTPITWHNPLKTARECTSSPSLR